MLFPKYYLPFPKEISLFESRLYCRLQMLSSWSNLKFYCLVKTEPFTTHSRLLMTLKKKLFEKIVGKGENVGIGIFSFSQNVFYSIRDRNHHFSNIWYVVCRCFESGQVQKFVVWKRVNWNCFKESRKYTKRKKKVGYQHFLLYPQCFRYSLSLGLSKVRIVR